MAFEKSPYEISVGKLFKDARTRRFPKNQIIFYQGDPLSSISLVEKGYLKAYTILDTGDTRTLFLLGPGDIFPIVFAVDLNWTNYNVKYFYQTLSDVEIRQTTSEIFKQNIESEPHLMNIYLSYMSATNDSIINQLEMMKTKGAINKVAFLLPYLVKKIGNPQTDGSYKFNLKISHQEIADLTGLTRETTTQQIKKLESDGIIQQKRGTWIIKLSPDQKELLRG